MYINTNEYWDDLTLIEDIIDKVVLSGYCSEEEFIQSLKQFAEEQEEE